MKNFEQKYYKHVPKEYIDKLDSFRLTHPNKRLTVNGVEWEYISCGNGEDTLLLLAGGMGVGEVFFSHILEFEKDYKVIVPTFPAVNTISELSEGIVSIMKNEGINRYNILGQSFGGILAQELIYKYPQNVDAVVLSHTTTSTPSLNETIVNENKASINKLIRLLKIVPLWMLRPLFRKKIYKLISIMKQEERAFWQAYFTELLYSKTQEQEIATYKCMLDFIENYKYTKDDFENWEGKMLILESDTDSSFDKVQKDAVRELFTEAKTYEFKGTGHLSIIVKREVYINIVKEFLLIRKAAL